MTGKPFVRALFWALVAVFVVVTAVLFVPALNEQVVGSRLFLLVPVAFSGLGLGLTVLVWRSEKGGRSRKFLLLTGLSAAGFVVFVVLHNAFYAVACAVDGPVLLVRLAEGLNVASFLAAVIACPLAFLVGAVGSIVTTFLKRSAP